MQEQTTTSQQSPEMSQALPGQSNISKVEQNLSCPSIGGSRSLHYPENMGCLSTASSKPGMEATPVGL